MKRYRRCLALLVLVGLLALGGAGCPGFLQRYPPEPRVLPPSPSIEQVIQAVNQNNSQIRAFSANYATLSGPGWPTLRASVAFERPRRLRLIAETGLTGRELDLGSNDQMFWFWVRRNQPPAIYYCRHEQFAGCPARQMIPVEPDWLIEALGTAELDPGLPYQGPTPLPGDRLEIRAIRETPCGPSTKIMVLDAAHGWILEQHIYDAQGQLKASSIAGGHHRDAATGLIMPATVSINVPAAQFTMRIDLGNVQVNRVTGNPNELWAAPTYPGYPPVDLGNPNLRFGPPPAPPATALQPRGPTQAQTRSW